MLPVIRSDTTSTTINLCACLQPILLEFNATPDIKQSGSRLDHVLAAMIDGMVGVAVDSRFPPPPGVSVERTPAAASLVWKEVFAREWPRVASQACISMD